MTTEVPSIGHILTANGLKPDPSKVQAVVEEMPSPADKPALLRFLGQNGELHSRENFCTRTWHGIGQKGRRKHSDPLKES